jgi:TetR/AcrR family transcriptional regulator, repressor for neighboring sulfatase
MCPGMEDGSSQAPKQKRSAASANESPHESRARRSREETTADIIDAAEELFSQRDPGKVTVREIAEKAGVTHPLVHQYVGSKEDIFEAVVRHGAPQRHRLMAEHPELREVVPLLIADVIERRIHSRAVLRSAMDGLDYPSSEDRTDTGGMLLGVARESVARGSIRPQAPDAMDPRIVMAAMVALAYGWVGAQDWLIKMFELEDEDKGELHRQIGDICLHVADLVFPPAGAAD